MQKTGIIQKFLSDKLMKSFISFLCHPYFLEMAKLTENEAILCCVSVRLN